MDQRNSLYQLTVRVHKAEGLQVVSGLFGAGCDPFVRVIFNGTTQRTQTRSGTSPKWDEEVLIPYIMPCWDDSITVELICEGGATVGETEMGEVSLSISELTAAALPATWYNFYSVAPEVNTSGFLKTDIAAIESRFGGRLLISANVNRTEKPLLAVRGGMPCGEPQVVKHVLWFDFYELCFDCPEMPEVVFAAVSMEPSLQEIRSEHAEQHKRSFTWTGDTGRMKAEVLNLPAAHMCSDVIVSIYARFGGWLRSDSPSRYMYCRLPAAEIFNWRAQAQWCEMKYVQALGAHGTAGFLLMSANGGLETAEVPRPVRCRIQLRPYIFRAKIYQCVSLPAVDRQGLSNPFIAIVFGSAMLKLSSKKIPENCRNPSFYMTLEEEVELPGEGTRPDVLVYVIHKASSKAAQTLATLKYETGEPGALPRSWVGPPKWLDLTPAPSLPTSGGRILAAFELAPSESAGPPKSIMPKTVDCRVEVYVIGIRMHSGALNVRNPMLEVAWGRDEDDSSMPKKAKYTKQTKKSSSGHYNFLQKVVLSCDLVKNKHYQEWLEVKVLTECENGEELKVSAYAAIQLAPFLPWGGGEEEEERERRQQELNTATTKARTLQKQATTAATSTSAAAGGRSAWKKLKGAVDDNDLLTARKLGWDHDSVAASNARTLRITTHTNLTKEDVHACREAAEANHDLLEESEWAKPFAAFTNGFTWPKKLDADDGLDNHPDLNEELEPHHLKPELLPYKSTPLFVGSEWGEPEVLGVLKFCCRVVEKNKQKEGGPEIEAECERWEEQLRTIEAEFKNATNFTVRGYVISADGLTPDSGSADCSSYIWSKATIRGDDLQYSNRDNLTVRSHTLHPQFNKCHAFSQCRLPDQALLEFQVIERVTARLGGAITEEVIGSTVIDIEDRWFHSRYHEMVDADIVPVEARELSRSGSCFNKGHLRLWIDILTFQQSKDREIVQLPSTEPVQFQLRIVIWRVTDISTEDGAPDLFVSGMHMMDDGTKLAQQTDTHYGADDGIGTFNWRLLFDVKIPCRDPRLQLTVWNDKTFTADDPLAEVTLDLSKDFLAARKGNCIVELQRGKMRLTHPSFPGEVRGILEAEGMLLPAEEAASQLVGKGREEPNDEPFLNPDDPHLKAHRDYFQNLDFVQNIKDFGGALWTGMKFMTMLYTAGSAIGGILTFGITIYMFLK